MTIDDILDDPNEALDTIRELKRELRAALLRRVDDILSAVRGDNISDEDLVSIANAARATVGQRRYGYQPPFVIEEGGGK